MISLITPNYNGEKWLTDCLDSVASQTLPQDEIEMILVDDGSDDGSREIIEGYRGEIPGLKPIWHEHLGIPGELRNIGIQRALGKYVLFLDSDDFLGVESLQRLDEFSRQSESDLIAFQLEGLNRNVPKSMLQDTVIKTDLVLSGLYKTLGTWKMSRRGFLDDNKIRFDPTQRRGEDALFFTEAMLKARSISILSGYPFYVVRGREDGSSITQTDWESSERIAFAATLASRITEYASDINTANHFMIRVFNTEAMGVIQNPRSTAEDLSSLRESMRQYWNDGVKSLIYTESARRALSDFFESEGTQNA